MRDPTGGNLFVLFSIVTVVITLFRRPSSLSLQPRGMAHSLFWQVSEMIDIGTRNHHVFSVLILHRVFYRCIRGGSYCRRRSSLGHPGLFRYVACSLLCLIMIRPPKILDAHSIRKCPKLETCTFTPPHLLLALEAMLAKAQARATRATRVTVDLETIPSGVWSMLLSTRRHAITQSQLENSSPHS